MKRASGSDWDDRFGYERLRHEPGQRVEPASADAGYPDDCSTAVDTTHEVR